MPTQIACQDCQKQRTAPTLMLSTKLTPSTASTLTMSLKCKDIARATSRDPLLSQIVERVKHGWSPKHKPIDPEYVPFHVRRNELSLHQGCLIWGLRVVILKTLQNRVLEKLHWDHYGLVGTKKMDRSYVWWHRLIRTLKGKSEGVPSVSCTDTTRLPFPYILGHGRRVHGRGYMWTWRELSWEKCSSS